MTSGERTALVTGTSSGIGEAVARELLERGWRVVGVSRRAGAVVAPAYTHVRLDLADVAGLARHVEESVGPALPDAPSRIGLVNNAADPGLLGTLDRVDPADVLRVFAVNVVAPMWLMGWVVRHSPRRVPLRLVNVSSGAARDAFPGLGVYGSTKAALRMAGMTLARELDSAEREGGERVDATVLSYEPGTVDTEMQAVIRRSSVETMPMVDFFERLAEEGRLVAPEGPAAEVADYLEGDGHERFSERRYAGVATG